MTWTFALGQAPGAQRICDSPGLLGQTLMFGDVAMVKTKQRKKEQDSMNNCASLFNIILLLPTYKLPLLGFYNSANRVFSLSLPANFVVCCGTVSQTGVSQSCSMVPSFWHCITTKRSIPTPEWSFLVPRMHLEVAMTALRNISKGEQLIAQDCKEGTVMNLL